MVYTNRERFKMIMVLGECGGNEGMAARVYAEKYMNQHHPDRNVFVRMKDSPEFRGIPSTET